MTVRNIEKSLAGTEDLALGIGTAQQKRGTIHRINVFPSSYNYVDMQQYEDGSFFRLYGSDTFYTDYRRNPSGTIGIPAGAGGVWEPLLSNDKFVGGNSTNGAYLVDTSYALWHADTASYYGWTGIFPHVVVPGTDPTAVGSGYVPRTDVMLRNEITQPMIDILKNSISVDRFGADPTGVLDSSTAFFNADAEATAKGNGSIAILLTPGATYRIGAHTVLNNPIICTGNRATIKFDYLWANPMSFVFPIPRQLRNVVFQAVNAGLHTVNLVGGEAYFTEIEKCTFIGFADAIANSGVYFNLRKCRFENNLRAWTPKTLSSQSAPSTMFSASETIFVGNVEDGLAVRPGTSGANDDLINLELRSCGFEQNGNGLTALQRIWNLTMVDCWFEGNVTKAYDIRASNPTLINVRVHPSDSAKTNISGWAAGTGVLSGNVNEIGEGGTQTRNFWLHDVSQDSYPSTKKTRIRKVGDSTRVSEDGGTTEKSLVLSSNLTIGTRTSIELYVPSTATSISDVVGAPSGWTMVKSGTGIYQFTLPTTLAVRPAIAVTPIQAVNLADEDKTAKVALGNTDAATWNSFKTVNQFRVYTKSVGVLTDVGFTLKMLV